MICSMQSIKSALYAVRKVLSVHGMQYAEYLGCMVCSKQSIRCALYAICITLGVHGVQYAEH